MRRPAICHRAGDAAEIQLGTTSRVLEDCRDRTGGNEGLSSLELGVVERALPAEIPGRNYPMFSSIPEYESKVALQISDAVRTKSLIGCEDEVTGSLPPGPDIVVRKLPAEIISIV
jgi:hypothetical protein